MIAGFCFYVKCSKLPSIRIKKESDKVSDFEMLATHRIKHIVLIINMFNT